MDGLFLKQDIAWNMTIASLKQISRGRTLHAGWRTGFCRYMERMRVKAKGIRQGISALSGGNQQKAIIAREIELSSPLMIFVQPTRGLDIGATRFVHETLLRQRDARQMRPADISRPGWKSWSSDRVAVMYEGRIIGILEPDEAGCT